MKKLTCLLWVIAAPLVAATFTVTNTNDTGAGSLRKAIDDANATPGADTITFNIPGAGVHTITPQSLLPIINEAVTIDGYTQPGSSPNTNATGGLNSVLQIEIVGTAAPNRCVTIGASNVQVRGLIINHCQDAIQLFNPFGSSVSGIVIAGNYLGTDAAGLASASNQNGLTCGTQGGSVSFTAGGLNPEDRNLISGNSNVGISTGSNFNGGSTSVVQGNIIGLDKNAANPVSNQFGFVHNDGGPATSTIGGLTPEAANIISGNATGIYVVGGTVTSTIRGNSIFGNALLGIKSSGLSDFSQPAANDQGDADGGANGQQNYPIVSSVEVTNAPSGGSTHILGVLHSTPSTGFEVDFYANPACTNFPREFLEGKTYVGSAHVDTDGAGTAVIDATLPVTVEAGTRITATATNPAGGTSEFSQRIPFSMAPSSGDPAGGQQLGINGTDILDGATVTIGGVAATNVNVFSSSVMSATAPARPAGTVNDVIVANTDGSSGTLVKGYVSDFLDVNGFHQFHAFVTTLVSNAITVGIGGGLFGVDQPTLRQQMAVFLMKSKHGLCFTPPPCIVAPFPDVPCSNPFAPWIKQLVVEGITSGCGGGNFCPGNPVTRQQMAAFLLKTLEGSGYHPPTCSAATFTDVPCTNLFADWIYELVARNITAGCGNGNYCPATNASRGQMATFLVKTFGLQ